MNIPLQVHKIKHYVYEHQTCYSNHNENFFQATSCQLTRAATTKNLNVRLGRKLSRSLFDSGVTTLQPSKHFMVCTLDSGRFVNPAIKGH